VNNILEVNNLIVKFDKEKIINNLTFKVKQGEFLTVVGPNGSGKTVLLKSLLGLISKYEGEVNWDKKAKIGYLPQGLTQLKVKRIPLTVREFLQLKIIDNSKIGEMMSLVGIKDEKILDKRIGNVSGGQFQRILMMWALVDSPNVLLFDEPTAGIDAGGEKTIYDLLYKIWKENKITIILITHDLNVVYKYSTNVLCVSRDNICQSSPKEVLLPEMLEEIYDMPIKFYKHDH
jgi:zinc transport system ATP-binding protein